MPDRIRAIFGESRQVDMENSTNDASSLQNRRTRAALQFDGTEFGMAMPHRFGGVEQALV